MMSPVITSHIELDAERRAWVAGANTKVIEFVLFNPLISIMMILEVMDKMPPLGEILAPVAFVGASAFFLCLWKPKACIVAFPFCWMTAGLMTSLIFEDYIGPAIRSEDPAYWYASALTGLACCLAPFLGSLLSHRSANRP